MLGTFQPAFGVAPSSVPVPVSRLSDGSQNSLQQSSPLIAAAAAAPGLTGSPGAESQQPPQVLQSKPMSGHSVIPSAMGQHSAHGGTMSGPDESALEPLALRNLIVNYLPPTMDELHLRQLFEQFGTVLSVKIIYDRETFESRGYGFVKFQYFFSATNAVRCLNGYQIAGKRLKVGYADVSAAREALPGIVSGLVTKMGGAAESWIAGAETQINNISGAPTIVSDPMPPAPSATSNTAVESNNLQDILAALARSTSASDDVAALKVSPSVTISPMQQTALQMMYYQQLMEAQQAQLARQQPVAPGQSFAPHPMQIAMTVPSTQIVPPRQPMPSRVATTASPFVTPPAAYAYAQGGHPAMQGRDDGGMHLRPEDLYYSVSHAPLPAAQGGSAYVVMQQPGHQYMGPPMGYMPYPVGGMAYVPSFDPHPQQRQMIAQQVLPQTLSSALYQVPPPQQ